jgi:2-keto-4-pentenoate hydratase
MGDILPTPAWLNWLLRVVLAGLLHCVVAHAGSASEADALAAEVRAALASGGVAPALSAGRPDLDLDLAYAVQGRLVAGWAATDGIAGYKSAFGSRALQQRFGLEQSATAVLPLSGLLQADGAEPVSIALGDYRQPMLETEVALRIGAPLSRAPATPAGLLPFIDAVMHAIEIPELALDGAVPPRGVDYIATNIGARRYVLGAPRPIELIGQVEPQLVLSRDGQVLSQGRADATLVWAFELVRQLLSRGFELEAGQVLLTGVVGALVPAEPGEYEADYGELGRIRFGLREAH